jgi:DNA polymerase I-like protein with 3'-5' exonuclease and polymerase domains
VGRKHESVPKKDIHKSTSKVFNVPLEEVTREQRSHAKTVNFGIYTGFLLLIKQSNQLVPQRNI